MTEKIPESYKGSKIFFQQFLNTAITPIVP